MATNRGEGRPTTADPSPAAAAAVIENSTAAASSRGENGAGPQPLEVQQPATIRVAAPSFGGMVRTVMIVVACAIGLYLLWRIRGVVRLVGSACSSHWR